MKISELIEFLTEQKEQYGDIEVWRHDYIDDDQGFIKCPLNKDIFYVDKYFYLAEDGCHYRYSWWQKRYVSNRLLKRGQIMNDNYYQIDVCFNFESESDKKAIDYFLKAMTAANIPLKNAQLKKFKRNCIGDFGTYIYPKDVDGDELPEEAHK